MPSRPTEGLEAGGQGRCCTGGPHIQYVSNSWRMTVDMRAQNLSRQGFVVLKVRAYAAVLTLAVGS